MPRPQRRGMSRPDLIAAVAVAGLAVGLTLPAVQKARADAAKATAADNLKKVGVGAQNFHDTFLRFTGIGLTGGKADAVATPEDSTAASFHYQLLPYVDEDNLYRNPTSAAAGSPKVVKAYLYPERNRKGHVADRPVTDFAVNPLMLYGLADRGTFSADAWKTGTLNLATVTDGSSNTVLAGPKAMRPGEYDDANRDTSFLLLSAAGLSRATCRHTDGFGDPAKVPAAAVAAVVYRDADPKLPAGPTDHFGGPDQNGVPFLFADGRVQRLSYKWLAPTAKVHAGFANNKPTEVSQLRAALTPTGAEVVTFE